MVKNVEFCKVLFLLVGMVQIGVLSLGGCPATAAESNAKTLPPTILTIKGNTSSDQPVFLDMAAIRNLPSVTFTTFDPWENRNRTYKGPLISDVLALAGIKPSAEYIEILATNDYSIPVRLVDLDRFGHILSYEMDGKNYAKYDGSENKGNLAVAIDFTDKKSEVAVFKAQLVWWVDTIVIY